MHHADELAESLLSEGITAMKIWPFDMAADASDGQYISNADLDKALEPINTFWHEDAIRMDSLDLLKAYAQDCKAMICASETLAYKWGFKDYL